MIQQEQFHRIAQVISCLQRADASQAREFLQNAALEHIAAGRDIFVEGDRVDAIALLLSGAVQVYKTGEAGRKIILYRFGPGEACILTTNAILCRTSFPAIATAEQQIEAVMLPADIFRDWVRRHDLWREFVFTMFSQRLMSIMILVDELAFRRMDARVARLLLQRSLAAHPIRVTHQIIALELGSSREVISRTIKVLTNHGLIRSSRGTIEIIDAKALQALVRV